MNDFRWGVTEKCAFHHFTAIMVYILIDIVSALVLQLGEIRSSGLQLCPPRRFNLERDTWTGRWPCSRPLPWGCIPFSP